MKARLENLPINVLCSFTSTGTRREIEKKFTVMTFDNHEEISDLCLFDIDVTEDNKGYIIKTLSGNVRSITTDGYLFYVRTRSKDGDYLYGRTFEKDGTEIVIDE